MRALCSVSLTLLLLALIFHGGESQGVSTQAAGNNQSYSPFDDMLFVSAAMSTVFAVLSAIAATVIFIYLRNGINRRVIRIRQKLESLDSKLQARVMREELFMKLCEIIGADYTEVSNERAALASLQTTQSPTAEQLRMITEEAFVRYTEMMQEIPESMGFRAPADVQPEGFDPAQPPPAPDMIGQGAGSPDGPKGAMLTAEEGAAVAPLENNQPPRSPEGQRQSPEGMSHEINKKDEFSDKSKGKESP